MTAIRVFWRSWDRGLLVSAMALCTVSLIALASAASTLNPGLVVRQAAWVGLGLALACLVASMPYPRWTDLAVIAYGVSLLTLAAVLIAGTVRMGAARWITLFGLSVQPSELAKLTTVWLLARYLAGQALPLSRRALMVSLILAAIPALLIFEQPDLGSAMILVAIWLGMVWVAGISGRTLAWFGGFGVLSLPLLWRLLKDYQRSRLVAFLNPDADPLGAGYTIIQSTIAIGSGQWVGRGWFSGTQNQLNFLPERHSDFLFSVIGEEWGLLGCVVVVGACAWLVTRGITIALENAEPQGRFLAVGIVSWVGSQAFMNMAMVMGLVPVVGVPLPLVSYGGSSMVAVWIGIGLLQSVRRFGTRF